MSAAAVQKEHGVLQVRLTASPSLGFPSCGVVTSKLRSYYRAAGFSSRAHAQAAVFLLVALCYPAAICWLFSLGPCVYSRIRGTLSDLSLGCGWQTFYSFWALSALLSAVLGCSIGCMQLINQYPGCAFYREVKVTGCPWAGGCCGHACISTRGQPAWP